MRKFLPLILVVLATVIVMAGCGGRALSNKAAPAGTAATPKTATKAAPEVDRTGWPVIVAFGDSLTFGQGVPFEQNYPSRLQGQLDKLGYKYRVVNAGISGDTSSGGLARVETVLKQKPAIVILELGANDGLQGRSVPKLKENLAAIIERIQKEQVRVVLAGIQIPPNYGPEYTDAFRQTFTDLAAHYKIPFIPFILEGVAARPELNQTDGIHPTAEGYVYVVDNVLKVLKPLLKQ